MTVSTTTGEPVDRRRGALPVFDADDVCRSALIVLGLSTGLLSRALVQEVLRRECPARLWWSGADPLPILARYGVDVAAWCRRLERSGLLIRAYHSTRAEHAAVFRQNGIRPLDVNGMYRRVRGEVLRRGSGYELTEHDWDRFVAAPVPVGPLWARLQSPGELYLFLSRRVMEQQGITKPHLHGAEFEEDLFRALNEFCDEEGIVRPEYHSHLLLHGTRGIILHCKIPFHWLDEDSRASVLTLMAETLFAAEAGGDATERSVRRCLRLHDAVPSKYIVRTEYTGEAGR